MVSSHCTILTPIADMFALSHIVILVLFQLIMQLFAAVCVVCMERSSEIKDDLMFDLSFSQAFFMFLSETPSFTLPLIASLTGSGAATVINTDAEAVGLSPDMRERIINESSGPMESRSV